MNSSRQISFWIRIARTGLPLAAVFWAAVGSQSLHAELAGIGDVTVDGNPAVVDSFGYGPNEASPDIGGEIIIGDNYLGGFFIDVAFDSGPLINTADGIVGNAESSYGSVSIDGFPSDWLVGENLIIGNEGTGEVDLFDSASIQVGTTTQGVSPKTIVSNTTDGTTTLGAMPTGVGSINLENTASRLVTAELIVGDFGDGLITASASAQIYSANAILGNQEDSDGHGDGVVELTDQGTRWFVGDTDTQSDLIIGNGDGASNLATGTLRIKNGAVVQVSDAVRNNHNGRIELTNGGKLKTLASSPTLLSIQNNGVILGDGIVDFVGRNMVNGTAAGVTNTTAIRNTGNKLVDDLSTNQREKLIFVGDLLTNNALIESLGGEMEFYTPVDNTVDGDIIARDSVLRFHEGLTNDGEVGLGGDTTLYGDITLNNTLFLTSDSNVLIRGSLTFNSPAVATLAIGAQPSFLDVLGDMDINGGFLTLDFDTGGSSSLMGQSYELISATGGVSGMFDNSVAVADGVLWDITYTATSVVVTNSGTSANIIGSDFNGDGIVDLLDLQIWKDNYGSSSLPNLAGLGDANGDGVVDGQDFLIWQQHNGGPPLTAVSAAVPEPGSFLLLLPALVCGLFRRR